MGRRPREHPRFRSFEYKGDTVVVRYRDKELMAMIMEQRQLGNDEPLSKDILRGRPDIDMFFREPPEDLSLGVVGVEGVNEPAVMPIFVNNPDACAITYLDVPEWDGEEDDSAPVVMLNPGQKLADGVPPETDREKAKRRRRWPDVPADATVQMPRRRGERGKA